MLLLQSQNKVAAAAHSAEREKQVHDKYFANKGLKKGEKR